MKQWETVAIVGVGLIGGSIGLALRERKLARNVIGIGRRETSLQAAVAAGAVTETTTQLAKGVAAAQLVIVATPVAEIAEHVRVAAASCPAGALITDVGSTKAQIVAELGASDPVMRSALGRDVRFLGSHPLAGSEKRGPTEARGDLLDGRTVVVTPGADSRTADIATIREFWQACGARVVEMSPEAHDQALARTSHLPHLAAAAVAAATPAELLPLVASGWRDTTRVAAGDPQLWEQIVLANRAPVLAALDALVEQLERVRSLVADEQTAPLRAWLAEAKNRRDAADQ